jgi:hypothetical protein
MRVKDLPGSMNVSTVKVRMPDSLKQDALAAGLDTMDVYVQSGWQAGIWVKSDLTSNRNYPIMGGRLEDTLEWEIVE